MRMAALVVALVALLALAACGSGDDSDSSGGGASDTPTAERGAFPVTIEHKFGKTEIETQPKRVVTVGFTEQDSVLALGLKPVGVREFLGGYKWQERPWAQEALGGTKEATIGGEEISYEKVAALKPDVIIGVNSGMTKTDYNRLSAIAPTVAQSDEFIDFGVPWSDQTLTTGKALGLGEKAQEVVDGVEAKFAKVREEHPEFEGKTFTMAYGGDGQLGAHASGDYRVQFFKDLGMKMNPEVDKLAGEAFYIDLDPEQFRLIDSDAVLMFGTRDKVAKDKVASRLDAVKEDRTVYVDLTDQFAGALGYASPLSLPYLIDRATPLVAAAVDDDPATKVADAE
jgi:iron complex transport system substrate-binding protein